MWSFFVLILFFMTFQEKGYNRSSPCSRTHLSEREITTYTSNLSWLPGNQLVTLNKLEDKITEPDSSLHSWSSSVNGAITCYLSQRHLPKNFQEEKTKAHCKMKKIPHNNNKNTKLDKKNKKKIKPTTPQKNSNKPNPKSKLFLSCLTQMCSHCTSEK